MANLYIVEGKQSPRYNHFKDYICENCIATDTRMMGVVALRISWKSRTSRYHLYQLIHLDFSEYGVDDYMEYFTDPAMRRLNELGSRSELDENWNRMSGNLGGQEVRISPGASVRLIEMAIETNEQYYQRHDPDIREFRERVLMRISLMMDALKEDSSYSHISGMAATQAVCPTRLTIAETINYFLMRMCDKDYFGAAMLSEFSSAELSRIPMWKHQLLTLMHNRIKSTKDRSIFHCAALAEGDSGYFYIRARIGILISKDQKNPTVNLFECDYFRHCSEVEAAMQTQHTEYVTVYELTSPEQFDPDMSQMISRAAMRSVPNGMLYLMYAQNNEHVDSYTYYMNNDVYGAYLLTKRGELVVMSPEVMKINTMEMDIAHTFMMQDLRLQGRYRFDIQVFQSFCEMEGVRFRDIIRKD